MDKALDKLTTIVLALVVLFILMALVYGPQGAFKKAEGAVDFVLGLAPDVTVGLKELSAGELTVDNQVQKELTSLKTVLTAMTETNKTNCFQTFGGFQSELGKDLENAWFSGQVDGVKINFVQDGENTNVEVNAYKAQVYDLFTVENMKPCVVAGTEKKVDEFVECYFIRIW